MHKTPQQWTQELRSLPRDRANKIADVSRKLAASIKANRAIAKAEESSVLVSSTVPKEPKAPKT